MTPITFEDRIINYDRRHRHNTQENPLKPLIEWAILHEPMSERKAKLVAQRIRNILQDNESLTFADLMAVTSPDDVIHKAHVYGRTCPSRMTGLTEYRRAIRVAQAWYRAEGRALLVATVERGISA